LTTITYLDLHVTGRPNFVVWGVIAVTADDNLT